MDVPGRLPFLAGWRVLVRGLPVEGGMRDWPKALSPPRGKKIIGVQRVAEKLTLPVTAVDLKVAGNPCKFSWVWKLQGYRQENALKQTNKGRRCDRGSIMAPPF
jgi:hypothetical protein